MAKTRKTKVTVLFPVCMDLAKLRSGNSLEIQISKGKDYLGTLSMGRGSVEWWPKGNRENCLHKTWGSFVALLQSYMR